MYLIPKRKGYSKATNREKQIKTTQSSAAPRRSSPRNRFSKKLSSTPRRFAGSLDFQVQFAIVLLSSNPEHQQGLSRSGGSVGSLLQTTLFSSFCVHPSSSSKADCDYIAILNRENTVILGVRNGVKWKVSWALYLCFAVKVRDLRKSEFNQPCYHLDRNPFNQQAAKEVSSSSGDSISHNEIVLHDVSEQSKSCKCLFIHSCIRHIKLNNFLAKIALQS